MPTNLPTQLPSFLAALVVVAAAGAFFFKSTRDARLPSVAARIAALLLALGGVTSVATLAWWTTAPAPVLAEAALTMGAAPLEVTVAGDAALRVQGRLAPVARGGSARAPYVFEVRTRDGAPINVTAPAPPAPTAPAAPTDPIATIDGFLEEHWERRKLKRGSTLPVSVAHLERVHELPNVAPGTRLAIVATEVSPLLEGALQVAVVPLPMREGRVLVAGIALTLATAILEVVSRRQGTMVIAAGVLGAYGVLLCESGNAASPGHLLSAGLLAVVLGALAGAGARAIALALARVVGGKEPAGRGTALAANPPAA